ncbi:MAG: hypothetical protein QOJ35_1677 [Solirubrobacteraceae bacterium]|nr:hypothetical protein [Solirubrobacteraceae bacterium]
MQNVLCAGIGHDVKFDLDSGVACTLVSAAIGSKYKKVALFIDGSCSGPTLAAHPDTGASSAIACGMLSDLLGAAPSPFIQTVAHSAGLACAFGRPFGGWIESLSERKAAQGVIQHGNCLKFTTHRFPATDVWAAVACQHADKGFFSPSDALRRCGEKTYSDGGPGYAVIVQDLRVRGVTCQAGLIVAGKAAISAGEHVPTGWRCTTMSRVVCSRGHDRVTFTPGGDAG